jgi:hypothetical protein
MVKQCQYCSLAVYVFLLFSCATNTASADIDISLDLDNAIEQASLDIITKLTKNTKVALINISPNESELTDYAVEELAVKLVNNGSLIVVERNNLEGLNAEQDFQLSGSVNDEQMISIADKYGAASVISCSISGSSNLRRLRVRTLDVKTGKVQALTSYKIRGNDREEAANTALEIYTDEDYAVETINDEGITLDYSYNEFSLRCVAYIDETNDSYEIGLDIDPDTYEITILIGTDWDRNGWDSYPCEDINAIYDSVVSYLTYERDEDIEDAQNMARLVKYIFSTTTGKTLR